MIRPPWDRGARAATATAPPPPAPPAPAAPRIATTRTATPVAAPPPEPVSEAARPVARAAAAERTIASAFGPEVKQAAFMAAVFTALYWRDIVGFEGPAFLAGLLFSTLVMKTALSRPRRLPLFLAAYLPFNMQFSYSVGLSINMTNVLLALLFYSWFSARPRSGQSKPFQTFDYLVLAFMAWAFISHVHGQAVLGDLSPLEFLLDYKAFITPYLIYFLIRAIVRDRDDLRTLVLVLAATAVLVGLVTIADGFERADRSIEKMRVRGLLGQSNSMGAYLAYYAAVPLGFLLVATRWKDRLVGLGGFLAIARASLFTFSRGAYLSLGIASLMVGMLSRPVLTTTTVVGYVATASVVPSLVPKSVLIRLKQTLSGKGSKAEIYENDPTANLDKSAATRLIIWQGAALMVQENPVVGVGIGRFAKRLPEYVVGGSEFGHWDAHNAYILTAGEMGVPGFLLLVSILILTAYSALRTYYRARDPVDRGVCLMVLGATLAAMMSSMFGSRLSDEALVGQLWILIAMLGQVKRLLAAEAPRGATAQTSVARPTAKLKGVVLSGRN